MPNDAKLGLVVGVGLVVVIAVVFFRREPAAAEPGPGRAAAVAAEAPPSPPNHVPAFPAGPTVSNRAAPPVYRHVVRQGETLYSLARHYYQDDRKFVDIFRANQEVLTIPDPLTPGTVLVIPKE